MLAAETVATRFIVPAWGCILLMGLGVVYLIFGTRWPRLFNVLSMTVLGCVAGMVASQWIRLAQPLVIILGGLVVGGASAFLRNVAHAVLAALVLAAATSLAAAMAFGEGGFTSYLVLNLSENRYAAPWPGPDVGRDPILAALLTGLLAGATLAIARPRFSMALVTAAQGAALVLVGLLEIVTAYRGEERPSVAHEFPLTMIACWLCLVGIGLVIQRGLARGDRPWAGEGDDIDDDEVEA